MMARPKGNDWLEDEILKLKQHDVSMVVSLLERSESRELELENERVLCSKHDIEFVNFPIQDRSIPEDLKSFANLIHKINDELKSDKRIAIHCRMGIGRTSVVAAAILVKNGMNTELVFDFLSKKRTLEVPDTKEQVQWLKDNASTIQQN